jgi:hypothetical protein
MCVVIGDFSLSHIVAHRHGGIPELAGPINPTPGSGAAINYVITKSWRAYATPRHGRYIGRGDL